MSSPAISDSESQSGRNLVVCIEGTASQVSTGSSNISELYRRLIKDEKQLTCYISGIGTFPRPSSTSLGYAMRVLGHYLDRAVALHVRTNVYDAYEWLSDNYLPGDRIFLFGFSRGAYQARIVAAMIDSVGLLHKGHKSQIPFAYELYEWVVHMMWRVSDKSGPGVQRAWDRCTRFKTVLCHNRVRVHFVGAWDTVSSIGLARPTPFPEVRRDMSHVNAFRHALALDECRVKFQPMYAVDGLNTLYGDVKEVWFTGSHSDIGGGKRQTNAPPLQWMSYEAMEYGIRLRPYKGNNSAPLIDESMSFKYEDLAFPEVTKSLTLPWLLLEYLPFPRPSGTNSKRVSYIPHLSAPRVIPPYHFIHQSVIPDGSLPDIREDEEAPKPTTNHSGEPKQKYSPYARHTFEEYKEWHDFFAAHADSSQPLRMVEFDSYKLVFKILHSLQDSCKNLQPDNGEEKSVLFSSSIATLKLFLSSAILLSVIWEVPNADQILLKALELGFERQQFQPRTLDAPIVLVQILATYDPGLSWERERTFKMSQIRLWSMAVTEQYPMATHRVLQNFGNWILRSRGFDSLHASFTRFSKNESIRICASRECMVWDWPADTLTTIYKFPDQPDNSDAVDARTMSADGSLIAIGCMNPYAITIINTWTGVPVQVEDLDHSKIWSVCFSHNSARLATGSDKGPVTVWKVGTDSLEPHQFFGHTDMVNALSFSPDDYHLASSSDDKTVRIWALDVIWRREPLVLEGHDSWACSVTWSPSGDRIASGGVGQIIIWDLQGKIIFNIRAHLNRYIWAIAFSPDGHQLVTGGNDGTLRVWNTEAQEQLWCFDTKDWVMSVAFSADGLHIVTGENNGMVCVWDMNTCGPLEHRESKAGIPTISSI